MSKLLKRLLGKKPKVFILDLDRPRVLKYGPVTVWNLTREVGCKNIKEFLNLSTSKIPIIVRGGLIWEDPLLTVKDVQRMIYKKIGRDEFKLGKIIEIVLKAIIAGCEG